MASKKRKEQSHDEKVEAVRALLESHVEVETPGPVVTSNPFGTAKVLPTYDTANTDEEGNPIGVYPEESTGE